MSGDRCGNLFLDSLAPGTRERLVAMLVLSPLKRGAIIGIPGQVMHEVYFPVRSVISTLTQMSNGSAVEVALAGHEGIAGFWAGLGNRVSPHSVIVQIPGDAYCLGSEQFRRIVRPDERLRERVLAYASYAYIAATQFVACNRLHQINERFARWLLMADDRVGSQEFALTQEFVAQMLGVRRAGVTLAATALSAARLISYRRGRISIVNREVVEDLACECYSAVNEALQQTMGYGARQTLVSESIRR